MCWQCDQLDKIILYYRALSSRVTDPQSRDGLALLIERLGAEKNSYHPERRIAVAE